ncbi:RNA-binding transcriptional accessory protein Tex [Bordetella avium]|uniref:RNA-binding transcriptional accessory protein Tex n=1 Tax=Bordetella avium TaxID=521 RepID=UPI000E0BCD06|nr:RNA-binding transcriptional accessory protein Tex [Bordetella avium]AZY48702.1 RNA-binding transcriptional accessory protein [Bordetella avium]RIQ14010.1 S1 RNA-binding domain-containing protein [Bordetella avium]RIQ16915.1 S1 RNA-binding domain-containing protein [Bordetella avium]RIQ36359.1 S1 RNA-binding domain-containing protein [Bordetella avium]RIQ39709.1 S1 RNA-binding domain-containing protein [Bordetella avium]
MSETSALTNAAPGVDHARIIEQLATELTVRASQVSAAVELLDDGATVPFIARYRKEATGGLDDGALRTLEVRLSYLRELEERRLAILDSINQQGKLSPELQQEIASAETKQRLEDLYAPYKPKRRTRAQIAREAGLEPLADAILADAACDPAALAAQYLNAEANINDAKAALDGARDILAERFAENADLLANMREHIWTTGLLYSKMVDGKEAEGANFRDWFDFNEPLRTLPSHRVLALMRGRQQGVLELRVGLQEELEAQTPHPCVTRIAGFLKLGKDLFALDATPRDRWLGEVCRWTWRVKLLTAFESEFFGRLREEAEAEAIRVFAANLKDLLLAAPAGPKTVLGLDPGIRTGCKIAVIDRTGKVVDTATVYPFEPRMDRKGTINTLAALCAKHKVELIAIGNGTASRESEKLVGEMMSQFSELSLTRVVVSEAGASVYSASEVAALEFPDLDVTLRGAVSIARRLQDPLAELVKIDPKAIGVGQYQHDVNQRELARSLDAVVEDCVNAVGVDVNTASAALLARVSGLNGSLAKNIVAWRDENGAFPTRDMLRKVPRFGEKAFEQAAGFLRIPNGDNPLDASAVHPEAYPVVERIVARIKADVRQIIGQREALKGVSPADFTDERFGLPTVRDIFAELEKPGRDPRPEFKTAQFKEGVETLKDLHPGMLLEGVVTNVANFGAFVDIGVHQDGLVHISALAEKFVKDPRDVVRVGQTVTVKVLEVDVQRKRVALTMRLNDNAEPRRAAPAAARGERAGGTPRRRNEDGARGTPVANSAMADAFAKLKR